MKAMFEKVFGSNKKENEKEDEMAMEFKLAKERALMFGTRGSSPETIERRVQGGMEMGSILSGSNPMWGGSTHAGPYSVPANMPGMGQSVFGGSINNKPVTTTSIPPFNTQGGMLFNMDDTTKARILLEYLQEKGVKYVNAATAKALFLQSTDIRYAEEIREENKIKHPKKKLKL